MVLTDGDRIRSLLGDYCRLIDAGDFEGVGALFAHATLRDQDGAPIATGAEEAAALYAATTRRHADGTPMTQHVIANSSFAEPAPDGSVEVTSNYLVFQATPELPLQPIITGGYLDTFAVIEGRWHFTDRRFWINRIGDLAQHLTIDPAT